MRLVESTSLASSDQNLLVNWKKKKKKNFDEFMCTSEYAFHVNSYEIDSNLSGKIELNSYRF